MPLDEAPRLVPGETGLTRRSLLAGSVILSALALSDRVLRGARYKKFVLVSVDTLRSDHLGCYGYGLPTSPALDALARNSIRFRNAFSTCSSTLPSVTGILTSRPPGLSENLLGNGWEFPAVTVPTLARSFAAARFRTAAFVGNYSLRREGGLTPGFRTYNADFDSMELTRELPERACVSLTAAASDWLRRNSSRPFFLWLHYQDPHGPYTPAPPYDSAFVRSDEKPHDLTLLDNQSGLGGLPAYQQLGSHGDLNYYRAQYDGEIAYWDASFGRFLSLMKDLGLMDETVIIVCADHGEAFGERGFYCSHGHGLGPELTHVPLVMRVPTREPLTVATPVSLLDVAPTMLALARLPVPRTFTGSNLFTTIRNGARARPIPVETSFAVGAVEGNFFFSWGALKPTSGFAENQKVSDPGPCGFASAPVELYDLSDDPLGAVDVKDKHPDWSGYLKGVCREYLAESAAAYRKHDLPAMDEATKAQLRALGYLN